jgi:hypothetical protein
MTHPRKLTFAQAQAIRADAGRTMRTRIGRLYGVSHQTVRRVLTWQTYKTPEPRSCRQRTR